MSIKTASVRIEVPLKVLVVDDNPTVAASVKSVIEDFGDVAETCGTGRDALSKVREFRPDVLLLDLSMPGMDGFEVASLLRQDRSISGLKIIAQTGHRDAETRKRTAGAGFDFHMTKPLRLDMIEDMLMLLRSGPRQAFA